MRTFFSEHRLLFQRSPDAPRGLELPSGEELRAITGNIEKSFKEIIQRAVTPENRRQIDGILEGLSKEFIQVKDRLFAEIQREIPNLGNYFRLGGRFLGRAAGYELAAQADRLRVPNGNQPLAVPPRGNGFLSALFGNRDGTQDVLELYGDDAYPFSGEIGGGFRMDADGIQSFISLEQAEDSDYSKERMGVLSASLAKLDDLRREMEEGEQGGGVQNNEEGVTVDPATGERRVGNVTLRPGETPAQLRERLNLDFQNASTAFEEQSQLVDKLKSAGASDGQLKIAQARLRELSLQLTTAEAALQALQGQRQPDQPR